MKSKEMTAKLRNITICAMRLEKTFKKLEAKAMSASKKAA